MHRVSFRRAAVGTGMTAVILALAVAATLRDHRGAAAKLAAAPAHVDAGVGEAGHEHLAPDPAATHQFGFAQAAIPAKAQATTKALATGAYHGTLAPPPTPPNPWVPPAGNAPTAYGGPALTLLTTYIGREAAEPTIGVTSEGKAFMTAGTFDSPGGVAARTLIYRSINGNVSWHPTPGDFGLPDEFNESLDPYVWVDPQTDRVYSGDLAVAGIRFVHSDDDGMTWTPGSPVGADVPVDHQTFITAEPVPPFTPVGYPNLMYFCSNRVADAKCSRSLDGGLTFQTTAGEAFLGADPIAGGFCGGLHGHLVSNSAGRLFLPKGHCSDPWVAISADSGTTWTRVKIADHIPLPHHEVTLAVDEADNIYAVWQDSTPQKNLPYLSYSTDHGVTWSTPRMIAPPGVIDTNFPTITAGHEGRIAINVPGTTETGVSRAWNQYLIISTNALSANPLFVWTTANDPATNPIRKGACGPGRCGGMFDFLDILTSPQNGQFWAAGSDTCAANCTSQKQVGDGFAVKQTGGPSLWSPTAVTLASFTAQRAPRGVTIGWRTASELDTFGYNVWRFAHGKGVKVNRTVVPAKAFGRAGGAAYRLVDRGARRRVGYTYRLQVVDRDGKHAWRATAAVRSAR
ncbi:MAG: sialidase family protein [Gaiellaceae bacterium]